jgi:hypothetical protein
MSTATQVQTLLPDEVVDELFASARSEESVGSGGPLSQPTKRPPGGTGNARNGSTPKTLITEHGPVQGRHSAGPQWQLRAADRA